MVQRYLEGLPASERERLRASVEPYLQFRSEVSRFQREFLSETCTQACFNTRESACCNRDGTATFFSDVGINALCSSEEDLNRIKSALVHDPGGFKCVYWGQKGCLWRVKPILFDDLEELFLQAGLKTLLMYCHLSPGLRRVKAHRNNASKG